ncbi:MAG: hypothetical protein AAF602_10885 [Myxococcota bacterium]
MMRHLALTASIIGCSNASIILPTDTGLPATDTASDAGPSFVGLWQLASGADPFDANVDDLRYLVIEETFGGGGVVQMLGASDAIGAPVCADGVYTLLEDRVLQVATQIGPYGGNERIAVLRFDDLSLVVTTPSTEATFVRVSDIPAAEQCGSTGIERQTPFALPVEPASFAGGRMLADGDDFLVLGSDGLLYPVSPGGFISEGLALDVTYTLPLAAGGDGSVWARAGANSSAIAQFLPVPAIVDEVLTDSVDIANRMDIAAASVAPDGPLVLHGFHFGTSTLGWLTVDVDVEPDLPIAVAEAGTFYEDITHHQGRLLGLAFLNGRWVIVEVDPTSGAASDTIVLPSELQNSSRVTLDGIASLDGFVHLMGRDPDGLVIFTLDL